MGWFNDVLGVHEYNAADRSKIVSYVEQAKRDAHTEYDSVLRRPDFSQENCQPYYTRGRTKMSFPGMRSYGQYAQVFDFWVNTHYFCGITDIDWLDNQFDTIPGYGEVFKNNGIDVMVQKVKDRLNENMFNVYSISIPLSNIEFFYSSEYTYTTTEVNGGGGTIGGSSIKGAIIGGMIAGPTGAIIGSRKEGIIQPVTSTSTVHRGDTTYLQYHTERGSVCKIEALDNAAEFYSILTTLIPEKEYGYVSAESIPDEKSDTGEDIFGKLELLKKLLDSGLLSQEEYETKKSEVLSRI